jgi:hypothetical protein
MRKELVSNPDQALVYMVECTLATVEYMAGLKSKSKSEYVRQQGIARTGIDWIRRYNLGVEPSSRVAKVWYSFNGSVDQWARSMEK